MKLTDMTSVSLEDRRGYLTLVICCQKEGRLLVRKTEGIREWHGCLTRSKGIRDERKTGITDEILSSAVHNDVGVKTKDSMGKI